MTPWLSGQILIFVSMQRLTNYAVISKGKIINSCTVDHNWTVFMLITESYVMYMINPRNGI